MNQNVDKLDQVDEFADIENIINRTAEKEIDQRTYGGSKFQKDAKSYLKKNDNKNNNKKRQRVV